VRRAATLAAVFAVAISALADDWFQMTRIEVRSSARGVSSSMSIVIASNGDFLLRTESGEMMVVGGRILLAKNVEMSAGAEIDALDAPVLDMRLAITLLEKGVPSGPASVRAQQPVSVSESAEPLEVSTSSASAQFPAPWSLHGMVTRVDATHLSFKLKFDFAQATQPLIISGTWERGTPLTFPDSLSTSDWRAFKLGPYEQKDAHGTMLDYGAQELPKRLPTLGDARAAAKKRAE
jgi:hypothetical protein